MATEHRFNPQELRVPVSAEIARNEVPNVNPWYFADVALDAIPDGWAKHRGQWWRLEGSEAGVNGEAFVLRNPAFDEGER